MKKEKTHSEKPRYYKRNSTSELYIALWPGGTSTSIYIDESKNSISRRDEPQTTAFVKFYCEQLSPVPEAEFVNLFHKTIASLQDDIYNQADS